MNWIFALAVITALVILWSTVIRPWLRNQPWARDFFANIEPFELWVYAKSESILWARWQQFLGLVLTATGFLGGIDWSVVALLTPDAIDPYLPAVPLILNVLGTIAEALRRDTTKPLAVVALPQEKPIEVAQAVARVEAANKVAEVIVEHAKKDGAV